MKTTKEQNRELCGRYPFLIPSNRYNGRRITEGAGYWTVSPEEEPDWDYEYTELDDMPDGWRIAFGEQLCEELLEELTRSGGLDDYRVIQIKEKYGSLRWYDNSDSEAVREILHRFEEKSGRICVRCGKPATRISLGWVCPYCDDCCEAHRSIPLEEYGQKERKGG